MVTINHLNLDKLTISTPEIVQSFQQNGSFNCSFWSAHELKTLACHIIETNTQSKKVDRFFKDLRVLRFSDEKKAVDLYALLAKDGRFDFLLPSMAEELASRVEQVAKEILDDSQVSDKPFQASLMPKNPALSDFANRVLNSIEVLVSTIDILINRGEFEEAIGLIKKMPQSPNKARVCESYLRANTSLNGEQIQELFTISGEDSSFASEIFYYYLRKNNPDAASVFMWVASSSYGSDFPDELRNKYLEVGDLEKAEALTFVCNPFNRNYLLIALFKAYVLKKETDPSINLSSIAKRITAGAQPDFKPDEFLKDLQSNVKTTEEFDKITPVYRHQYNRDSATLESIAKHLKSDQLQTAIDLISQIKSSIKKDQANLTLIKHLLEKNRIEEAKARLDFIKSPDTKGDAYLLILFNTQNLTSIDIKRLPAKHRENAYNFLANRSMEDNQLTEVEKMSLQILNPERKNEQLNRLIATLNMNGDLTGVERVSRYLENSHPVVDLTFDVILEVEDARLRNHLLANYLNLHPEEVLKVFLNINDPEIQKRELQLFYKDLLPFDIFNREGLDPELREEALTIYCHHLIEANKVAAVLDYAEQLRIRSGDLLLRLIGLLIKNNQLDKAHEWLDQIEESHTRDNALNLCITAYLNKGEPDKAVELESLKAGLHLWEPICDYYLEHDQLDKIEVMLSLVKDRVKYDELVLSVINHQIKKNELDQLDRWISLLYFPKGDAAYYIKQLQLDLHRAMDKCIERGDFSQALELIEQLHDEATKKQLRQTLNTHFTHIRIENALDVFDATKGSAFVVFRYDHSVTSYDIKFKGLKLTYPEDTRYIFLSTNKNPIPLFVGSKSVTLSLLSKGYLKIVNVDYQNETSVLYANTNKPVKNTYEVMTSLPSNLL